MRTIQWAAPFPWDEVTSVQVASPKPEPKSTYESVKKKKAKKKAKQRLKSYR